MDIAVSNRVVARDDMGRFIDACRLAGRRTVEEAIKEGADLSRELAPVGHKADPRTIPLAQSITSRMTGATSGVWEASARHALPQEFGAAPHEITGDVHFFWEREGRMWEPGDNVIDHPGNPAQPYLRPAYEEIMAKIMDIARRYYPG